MRPKPNNVNNTKKPKRVFNSEEVPKSALELQALFERAVSAGFIDNSEASRIRFFGAVVYAARIGDRPRNLLAWIIDNRKWDRATAADENAARNLIRELDIPSDDATNDPLPDVKSPSAELTPTQVAKRRREILRQLAEIEAEEEVKDDAQSRRAAC